MIIHVNVKYFFSFTDFFPSPSIELRFNCCNFHIQDLPLQKYGLSFSLRLKFVHARSFNLTKESPISPNPRSSSRPSGGQNSRPGSRPTGTSNRPGPIPAFRQWHRSGTVGRTTRRTGKFQNRGGSRPGGNTNRQRPQGGGGRHTKGRKNFNKSEPKEENSESEIEVEGTICAVLAGTMFKVRLPNGHEVLAHISGKMRKRFIKIVVGDKVRMEMSPYDMTKARITFRIG